MQKKLVVLVDDLDNTEAHQTISFSFKGVSYEIDLSDENVAEFEKDLSRWISAARRVGGRLVTRSARRVPAGASQSAKIREWARAQNIAVNERGRIPAELVQQYEKEHARG